MNESSELAKIKIGCVRYLNAKPLIYGYRGAIRFEHPSRLAELLANGEVDLALLSSFEALRDPHFLIADGCAISSVGEVFSVFLAYKGDLKKITRIALDPASLTSAHLLQILLAEFHGMTPEYVPEYVVAANGEPAADADEISDSDEDDCAAQLLIGNQAIDFRVANERNGERFQYLDLGAEWLRQTGLPFVYAVWMMNPAVDQLANPHHIGEELRAIKTDGLAHLDEIVVSESSSESRHSAEFCRSYLGGYIRYELGGREKAGLALFRELLIKHRHISANHEPLRFR